MRARIRQPRAPLRAVGGCRGGSAAGARSTLLFAKWRDQNAQMGESTRGPRLTVGPRRRARPSRSPERVKRATFPVPQLEAFAGEDIGKKGREGG